MAQVAFRAAGAGAENNSSTTLAVPFPASVAASELLILVLGAGIHSTGFQDPGTGWERHPGVPSDVNIGTVATIGAECISVWYKWAVGDETGDLTCSRTTGTDHFIGRMVAYNGFTATGADPFVGSATNSGTDASMESPATAAGATADNDMGLLVCVRADDDSVLGNWDEAAETVEWTESVAEFLATSGNDAAITFNHAAGVTTGNAIPANLETASASDPWWILTCIIKEAAGSGAAAYELDCQPGGFTLTGAAATTAAGRAFEAAPATYAVTGAAATTARGLFLSSDPASYTLTGVAASTVADRAVEAGPGAFDLTGVDATTAAGRVFAADPGTYTLTGVDATLTQETPGVYNLSADPGSFVLTGAAATVVATRELSADPATYTLTGTAATLQREFVFNAEPAAFTLTGVATTFVTTRALVADPGAFTLTGVAATLRAEGQAPNMDEILTGWIAAAAVGRTGAGTTGRIRTPTTGAIA